MRALCPGALLLHECVHLCLCVGAESCLNLRLTPVIPLFLIRPPATFPTCPTQTWKIQEEVFDIWMQGEEKGRTDRERGSG